MEIDKNSGNFNVLSTEPFGRLLIEVMSSRSLDESVYETQMKIGQLLVHSYLEEELSTAGIIGVNPDRVILYDDMAKDISTKAVTRACDSSVLMSFEPKYFEGLEILAEREVRDLDDLYAELQIVSIAYENDIPSQDGILVDDQDIRLIEDEIEQAEASKYVLELLKDYRNRTVK